jgi:hypothetical protein
VTSLLAIGPSNTLDAARAEDDLARRDVSFDELRAPDSAHFEDAAARERMAEYAFRLPPSSRSGAIGAAALWATCRSWTGHA